MIHRLLIRALRDALSAPRFIAPFLLLGLVTLSGCHGDGSSISPHLLSLQVTPTNPSVAAGTSVQLTATGIYSDNSHADVTTQVSWTTSNTAVATVGASTGTALGVAAGTATLSVSLQGLSATTTLTVTRSSLVSIAVTPSLPSIAAGTNEQFAATGTFSDNTTQNLTADLAWASSNTAIATVSSSGLASAVGPGSATITATCKVASTCSTLAGSATLTVTAATLVSIAITPPVPSIALGTSETFTATGTYSDNSTQNLTALVTWSSASPSVAKISNATGTAGVATSVATGTTLVTAALGSVTSPAVTFTITPATLVSIAITPSAPSIALGTSETFTATGTYSDNSTQNLTTQVTWNSATLSVATISNAAGTAGVATSVATGTTLITAALGSVTSLAVTFTVTPATLVSIAITLTSPSIPVAGIKQLIATGTYSDNSTQILTTAVTWASSDASIAPISNASGSQGQATGLVVGSTSISATLGSVTSPVVTLTVTPQMDSVLHAFTGVPDGSNPVTGLIQGTDGNFYGTTSAGGTHNDGTVFVVTPGGTETVLYSFAGGSDGANPQAGLILGSDGNFYGTTASGGTDNLGTVFKITSGGAETVLHSFTAHATDGASPFGGLIEFSGNFYGTTAFGGTTNNGTVFRITPGGAETVLYSFPSAGDGRVPAGNLILGSDGNFYGITVFGGLSGAGGANGDGTVFKITPTGMEAVVYSFGSSSSDGVTPQVGLILGSDGNFYGTTPVGGTNGDGTVFKITPSGTETVLYSFGSSATDGQVPDAPLIQGSDGNFYGTTATGGSSGSSSTCSSGGTCMYGTVFKITPSGTETILYNFTSSNDGGAPEAPLIIGSNGSLFGTTSAGGTGGNGTVFELTPN
jgi:uncharacterized repeat protein (TIGR03803 family)